VREKAARKEGNIMQLETNGVCKYFGGLKAVDGVDFSLSSGQLKSIIGPNGAGKTTFFNLLSGFYLPTKGAIRFEGKDISRKSMDQVSQRGITKTFQITQIFPRLTVFENVRIAAQSRKTAFNFWRRAGRFHDVNGKALEVLELVMLLDSRERIASNLSHGEKRYLEIGMALAAEPKVLLLDEPTAGMSPAETVDATHLIRDIADRLNLTIVLVEHDMSVVMEISDDILVLHEGKVLAEGNPKTISDNEEVQRVYLGGGK
jgi:branched-chain amino acid transport system ATP-binding protein